MQVRDNLTDAPRGYLLRLHRSVAAMTLLAFFTGIVQAGALVKLNAVFMVLLVVFGTGWAAAVYMVTTPRPFQKGMRANPAKEMARLRLLARLTQLAWPLQGVCLLVVSQSVMRTPATTSVLLALAGVFQLFGALGFAPLCVWLAHLADWAQDTGLAGRLRVTSVLIGVGGVLAFSATLLSDVLSGNSSAYMFSFVAGLALLAYGIGIVMFAVSQMQMGTLTMWAIKNSTSAAARDQRVLERKARRTFTGEAAAGSALAQLTAARGEHALDPCAGCGYDLTGVPAGAVCPECGRAQDADSTAFLRRPVHNDRPPPMMNGDIPLVGDEPDGDTGA